MPTRTISVLGLTFGYNIASAANVQTAAAQSLAPPAFNALQQGVLGGSVILGAMLGSLAAGSIVERFGRKIGMLLLGAITAAACAASAAMPNFWALAAMRMILGLGVGSFWLSLLAPLLRLVIDGAYA